MATTPASQQPAATPPKSGKLKRILLIVLIALLAAGAAAGGTYFFLAKRGPAKPAVPPPPPPPVFYALDPMTVNLLSDDGTQHYLRVGLTLKVADEKMKDRVGEHLPELRSRILLDLSNKHPEDLQSLDGKRALATELQALIEKPTEHGAPPIVIRQVLFTEFVVQ